MQKSVNLDDLRDFNDRIAERLWLNGKWDEKITMVEVPVFKIK
jgi:hypothetical protein